MQRQRLLLLPLFLWIGGYFLGGCAQATLATPQPTTLTIAGSTEMRPVLTALTATFSRRHPNVLFSLRGGGSTLGEQWVASGQVDIAASTLVYPDAELADGLERIPFALDGIAVIVNVENDVSGLTLLQLQDLYSGRSLDWQDVGGSPGEILLVSREDGSGTRALFEERVMGDERVALTAVVMPTSADVVSYVAEHPQAIGYVSRSYLTNRLPDSLSHTASTTVPTPLGPTPTAVATPALDVGAVKVLPIEGLLPLAENLAVQRYHLSRPLYLILRAGGGTWENQFIDFVLSPAGQEIVARYHAKVR